ncbi:MAG: ABC transporter ATP-binding protein [Myxococcales bacterium]|nr:ABC transporter ATP-binding protein [Myxococcales bacterium]
MRPVLDVHQLSRRYADRLVLDAVSFQVAAGEIHGLLGPNGAGKTTALECAEGLRKPDSGDITFLGERVRHGRVPAGMGVQLQVGGLPGAMTVEEALRFVSAYKRAPPRPGIVVRLGLAGLEKRPYQQLSVGQQRRLQLALAIAHQPALLILDEPTAGLDVATRTQLHALLAELKSEGTAIILATHDMAEAEKLADQLTVLIAGRVATHGTPREITRQGDQRTRIAVRTTAGGEEKWRTLPAATLQPSKDGYAVFLSDDPAVSVRALLDEVARTTDSLVDLRVERPSLEERFLELTRREAP